MSKTVAVLGAGAFGTALALVMARNGRETLLWGRPGPKMETLARDRINHQHLPDHPFGPNLQVITDLAELPQDACILLAIPTQALRQVLLTQAPYLANRRLVCCCKGVERGTGLLPSQVIEDVLPGSQTAALTGPSFAADIAAGKPTALTLATSDIDGGPALQHLLSAPDFRLYLSHDPIGAQLGGALKNVIAIAAGIAIGAGLGESARAALMTRGFAEMGRFATSLGGQRATLFGLAGFGDMVLTCTSTQSRNLRHGLAIGAGEPVDPALTVEGVMTAHAIAESAKDLDLPLTRMVSALLKGEIDLQMAITALMSRPLRHEDDIE